MRTILQDLRYALRMLRRARFHRRRHADARPWHRRRDRDLQHHQRRADASAQLSRAGARGEPVGRFRRRRAVAAGDVTRRLQGLPAAHASSSNRSARPRAATSSAQPARSATAATSSGWMSPPSPPTSSRLSASIRCTAVTSPPKKKPPGGPQVVILSHRLWASRYGERSGDRRPPHPARRA